MIGIGIGFGFADGFQEMSFPCSGAGTQQGQVANAGYDLLANLSYLTLIDLPGCMVLANHISSIGPLLAYVFIAYMKPGSRSVYWYCFGLEVSATVLLLLFYHPPKFEMRHPQVQKTKLQLLEEIDYLDLTLFTSGCRESILTPNKQYIWWP